MTRGAAVRLAVAAATAAATTACGTASRPGAETPKPAAPPAHGVRVLASAEATDFALRDQTGRSVSLSAQRGKVVLLTFLYTNCRDVCPRIADTIDAALGRLGAGVDHVRALAVSVDPVGDTPLAVRRFAASHRLRPQFRYLTGTRAELQPVWQAYNVLAEAPPNGAVSHSSFILLIGRSGRPLLYYPPNVSAPVLARDVRRALSSPRQDAS